MPSSNSVRRGSPSPRLGSGPTKRPRCRVADTFIQKTKKQYVDPRNTRNMSKMNEDLADLTGIMQQNIQDLLGRGEKLESVLDKATNLRNDSSKYAKNARYLNTQAMLRKYGPIAFVVLVVFAMLWWRFR